MRQPWERWLGDLAYDGAIGIITKHKEYAGVVLTHAQLVFNNIHEFKRNHTENVVGAVKNHRMFKGDYQGSYEHLEPFLIIVGHVTAYEIHSKGPRFECYGPWPH